MVVHGLNHGNFGIIADVVMAATDDPAAYRDLLEIVADKGVRSLSSLCDDLSLFVAFCFGIDADAEHPAETREKAGKEFSIEAGLEQFFEIGTGWLGWSPTDTWAATPAEIIVAQRGLVARLKAIHGSAEETPEYDPLETVSPEQVREGIARLRVLARQTQ
ncbi:hypothetical protein [Mesorhizobium sp. LSHC412B00]|uniref:hypothetical protein n=1 Tax=Mesorhizobium sp. LSHC412B00 TaxID=1287285 RepID=UPI0012EC30A4|nr:hypothetical protein [Mesorhizobium sp. LSHC412B00]